MDVGRQCSLVERHGDREGLSGQAMTGHRPIRESTADPLEEYLRNLTRRRFFGAMASTMGAGIGSLALGSLMKGMMGGDGMIQPPSS